MRHLRPVMAGCLFKKFPAMDNAAAFGVGCGKNNAADARERDCARAHRARLQRDIQIIFGNTLRAVHLATLADDKDFRMGGGVVQFAGAVAVPRNN